MGPSQGPEGSDQETGTDRHSASLPFGPLMLLSDMVIEDGSTVACH